MQYFDQDDLTDTNSALLNTEEAAKFLGTSVQFLKSLRSANIGPKFCEQANDSGTYKFGDLSNWLYLQLFCQDFYVNLLHEALILFHIQASVPSETPG